MQKSDSLNMQLFPSLSMAGSWREAKECATRDGLPQVYHDCDDNVYGACGTGERQGMFKSGVFIEHRCLCMPANLSCEGLEEREKIPG